MKVATKLLLLAALASGCASPKQVVSAGSSAVGPSRHLETSTMIECPDGSYGSGVIFKNADHTFVWTAAHVLRGCQHRGDEVATYDDVTLITDLYKDGRRVGETRHTAKIIRYGAKHDLAVLMADERGHGKFSATFNCAVPEIGAPLWHVGSFHGPVGINSVSEGIISTAGRLRKGLVYDQVSLVAHPGSSGGGVFLKGTGECVGIMSRFITVGEDGGFPHGALLVVPTRRMKDFVLRTSCEWAMDGGVEVPGEVDVVTDAP